MLSPNIRHIEDIFQVYVIEISTREQEGGKGCRNAQTVYHHKTSPSTHWTGGCLDPTSGLDAFEKRLFFPAWSQTLIRCLLVPGVVSLPTDTSLLLFPWETDENHRKLQAIESVLKPNSIPDHPEHKHVCWPSAVVFLIRCWVNRPTAVSKQ